MWHKARSNGFTVGIEISNYSLLIQFAKHYNTLGVIYIYIVFRQYFLIRPIMFSFVNFPPTCSSSYSLNKFIRLVIVFVICSLKMAPAGVESTWEKYGAFFISFHPDVKRLIRRLERITN